MCSMRKRIKGLTPIQIKELTREELEIPIRTNDILESLGRISSSVSQGDIKRYEEWMNEFGSQ